MEPWHVSAKTWTQHDKRTPAVKRRITKKREKDGCIVVINYIFVKTVTLFLMVVDLSGGTEKVSFGYRIEKQAIGFGIDTEKF